VRVHETYRVPTYEGPAQLEVLAQYSGATADYYRYVRRYSEPIQTAQQLTGTLARFYPHVRSTGGTVWEDDRDGNVLTARSTFEVPELWTKDAAGKFRLLEVYPWALSDRLPRPETTERKLPFSLPYPYAAAHEIEMVLPKEWPAGGANATVQDDTFVFRSRSGGEGKRVWVNYEWRTTADAVPAARMGEWLQKMAEVRNALGYQLRQNIRLAEEMKRDALVWPLLLAAILGAGGGLGFGIWLYRRQPVTSAPPLLPNPALTGIGGFLIVVAIGMVVRPLLTAKDYWTVLQLIGNHPAWISRTDPESAGYAAGYFAIVVAEAAVMGFLLCWAVVMVPQFFRRKASLPFSFVVHLAVVTTWVLVHLFWANQIPLLKSATAAAIAADAAAVAKVVLFAAIWIPYMLVSRRVKLTFTR